MIQSASFSLVENAVDKFPAKQHEMWLKRSATIQPTQPGSSWPSPNSPESSSSMTGGDDVVGGNSQDESERPHLRFRGRRVTGCQSRCSPQRRVLYLERNGSGIVRNPYAHGRNRDRSGSRDYETNQEVAMMDVAQCSEAVQ